MSTSSSLSGISFSGIGSGIDTQSMIERLSALERIPISRLQQQKAQLQARQSAYTAFRGMLQGVTSSAAALNTSTAFSATTASSSKPEVATVTAVEGASAGTFNLAVSKLAQAHKISSAAQTDVTTALGYSGTISLNGRGVTIAATDTLTTIAQKINGAEANVTASLINGGTGSAYITLTSKNSGASNKIQIADVTGTLTSQLGLQAGATSVRSAITNGFQSATFSSNTSPVGTMLGATGLAATTIELNSTSINVDLSTMSLTDVASAINASAAGVTATVKSVTENGSSRYQLEIVGASTPTTNDPGGVLQAIGILQKAPSSQLLAAQDAAYSLDGMNLTSSTNAITGVMPGVTLTLLKANETTPETSVLTLTQDNTTIKNKVKDFMNAFNAVVDFVKQNSAFDKETYQSGLLFGDSTVQSVEGLVGSSLFATVTGIDTQYSNLTQVGFAFDSNGKLKLDESILDTALTTNTTAVSNLFRTTGSASNTDVSFVSAGTKTVASGALGYSVVISALAAKQSYTVSIGGGGALGIADKLTFSGATFGGTSYDINFAPGATIDSIVTQINNDATTKNIVTASNVGGKLVVEAKKYGTPGTFTMAITGTGGEPPTDPRFFIDSTIASADVAGTINGETCTGSGQFLTGATGNAKTEALQIQYAGTVLGPVGTVKVAIGVAANVNGIVNNVLDTVTGLLSSSDKALTDQIQNIDDSITRLEERVKRRTEDLRRKFTAMETTISAMQQQASRLGAMTSNLSK